jgi:hypothetical protein
MKPEDKELLRKLVFTYGIDGIVAELASIFTGSYYIPYGKHLEAVAKAMESPFAFELKVERKKY